MEALWPHIKRFWKYVWEADTATAYVLNILVAFIIIKFIVYPGLGLLFGTGFPVVAVVSSSMEHDGNFETWWNSPALCGFSKCSQGEWYATASVSQGQFKSYFFKNGFNKGDVIVLFGTPVKKLKVGDVIVFRAQESEPIIHRLIGISQRDGRLIFMTKGDHNPSQLSQEMFIDQDQVIGRAVFRVPYFGYIKIWFVQLINVIRF